ncbi:DUF975 family protein [Clostridium sp.]|uniref:DUF975 family protein n=1 Tax=Clostridium sp. TaxID=1506 RepID=UPI003D6D6BD9
MWSREVLKDKAKAVLKVSYWRAFWASLVIAIIGGNENSSFNLNWNSGNRTSTNGYTPFPKIITNIFPFLLLITVTIIIVLIIFAIAFRILVGYPLEVGGRRFFVQLSQNKTDLNYLGYGFSSGRYFNIVTTMLWRTVLTFLWTLLLIVPGIIKTYAYRMVPYILSDNPNISCTRALELSNKMTDGNKMDMWILDLSFIGWYLLGTILLLVGVLFVMPYENATKAELYIELRKTALDQGICSYDELQLKQPLYVD